MTVYELSNFFKVSQQCVMIRMNELQVEEIEDLYNNRYLSKEVFEIDLTNFYYEYRKNAEFKKLIDNAAFLYIENCCVVNNEKYIDEDKFGNLRLSNYARENKNECCLKFQEKIILNRKRLKELSSLFYRGQDQAYIKCIEIADDIINGNTIKLSKESQKAKFENAMKFDQRIFDSIVSDFGKSITNIIEIFAEELNFDSHKIIGEIEELTYINKKTISDMKLKGTASKKTILAFGVGLGLGIVATQKLLQVAGHSLQINGEDYPYYIALSAYRGKCIGEINTFLDEMECDMLGSK